MHDAPDTSAVAAAPFEEQPLVRIRGLGKRFGGTIALAGVDLDVHAGGTLALLGPNGAGKSTLIKVLAGVHHADAGRITVAGHPLGSHAASRNMSFIHQDLGLVEWMSVAENIALSNGYSRRAGLISWRRTRERCADALEIVARHLDPDAPVAELDPAERSLVAIARALAARTKLVVLDEPTARLPAADCARLFGVLHALRDRGHAILYVTHRLDEVYRVADAFAVLRDGRLVSHGPLAGHSPVRLVHDIVGEELTDHHPSAAPADGPPVLALDRVRTAGAGPVGLELRAGEVVGLVGLSGAGHMDLGRALAGSRPLLDGRVLLRGRPYHPRSVTDAVSLGVGFVPGDRLREGCAAELTVRENLLANPRAGGLAALRPISPRRERAEAATLIERLAVRPRDSEAPLATLSGGNQQKVMIGRWLRVGPRLLILEEPTASVDVGAKAAIYRLLDEALAAGLAVLLISTDFEEVASVCRRALVFVRGVVTAELSGAALTVAGLTRAASAMAPAGPPSETPSDPPSETPTNP
ncbi:sugar ABC transporter ATP-binding protein [Streptomyces sp. NPDC001315]|uniref:sugar ABC transporter ATP-binding protein n=1 Tax=Streptomyces sp. NPDC001315 TaxID=3364562 RepID=UPI0036C8076F